MTVVRIVLYECEQHEYDILSSDADGYSVSGHVLVTGGCGFVGSHIALSLRQRGWQVTCLDNLSRRGSEFTLIRGQAAGCRFVHGDVRNPEDLLRLGGGFDLMIECSAEPSVQVGQNGRDALFMVQNNLMGTVNCLEYARTHGLSILFLSTSRVYPYTRLEKLVFREEAMRFVYSDTAVGVSEAGVAVDFPLDGLRTLYGATKLASELLSQEYSHTYQMPAIINRCGVLAGPWQMGRVDQGFVTFWVASHYFEQPLRYIGYGGRGKQVRDILHIDDLVDLVHRQIEALPAYRGEVFNVGGGARSSVSLCEMTELCRRHTGRTVPITPVPEARPGDVIWYVTDNGITPSTFGWQIARSPGDIVTDTLTWLKQHERSLGPLFKLS